MLFELHQYDIKICHYNMVVFAVFIGIFKLIHFLLPDLSPVALNDALGATIYEHVLSVRIRVMER